jgi:hypothetical protein
MVQYTNSAAVLQLSLWQCSRSFGRGMTGKIAI